MSHLHQHCATHSDYFGAKLFTQEAATQWLKDTSQYPMDPAQAQCERYDTARNCPTGPCFARTGWNFMPGQIANWKWSVDYDSTDLAGPIAQGNAPFFQAERTQDYCGKHLSWNRLPN